MERRVIAYCKADGEVVSRTDPAGRPVVFDRLPVLDGQRWISVGRLDVHTEGLLLLTNDAELANRLMHPSTGLEREFAVGVQGALSPAQREVLLTGVMLEDGLSQFLAITDAGEHAGRHWYRCSVSGGKFREVRRLWESQGFRVERLVRIRFGTYAMPPDLAQGQWREVDEEDIEALEALCSLPAKKHTGLYGRARRMIERQERSGGDRPRKGGGYLRSRR